MPADARAVLSVIRKELQLQVVADAEDGLATHSRLLALGFSAAAINWRVRTGRLHRRYRSVYVVGRRELSQKGEFRAAVLAVGEGAVLSHFAAAAHHGVWKGKTTPIDITVPRRIRSRRGIRVHTVAALPRSAITIVGGIPATTIERHASVGGSRREAPSSKADHRPHLERTCVDRHTYAVLMSIASSSTGHARTGRRG
jgi:hypothetical protein